MARGIDKQKRLNSGGTKTNPNHIVYGNKDGQIEFGHLHLANSGNVNGDVTSGVMLQALSLIHI